MIKTDASRAFEALSDAKKIALAREVFEALEYNSDDMPGAEWDSDTTQALGDLFGRFGITFTDPGEASYLEDLLLNADIAYDADDQDWFDSQETDDLVTLWQIACDPEQGLSYDDEVYDALAKRGHFDTEGA